MFCTTCGKQLEAAWSHCSNCGTAVSDRGSNNAEPLASPQTETSQVVQPAPKVNAVIWVFLAMIAVAVIAITSLANSARPAGSQDQQEQVSGNTQESNNQAPQQVCNWEVRPNVNYIAGSHTSGFDNQYEKVWVCR